MSDMTIEVVHQWRGSQPRAYGPHRYETTFTVVGERAWDRLTEDQAKDLAKVFVPDWEREVVPGDWCAPRLGEFRRTSEELLTENKLGPRREVWKVVVEVPFTD